MTGGLLRKSKNNSFGPELAIQTLAALGNITGMVNDVGSPSTLQHSLMANLDIDRTRRGEDTSSGLGDGDGTAQINLKGAGSTVPPKVDDYEPQASGVYDACLQNSNTNQQALVEESKNTSNARSSIEHPGPLPQAGDLIDTEQIIAASQMIKETDKTNSVQHSMQASGRRSNVLR